MDKIQARLLFTVIFLLMSYFSIAQTNSWIDYNKTYYKIPISETGMYQVTQAEIISAGISGVNPKNFQIYHRGQEQSIFVEGESDNSFDSGDFIQFYAKRNDGDQDKFLYKNISNQVNPYYNLYSDTTAYFLTWTIDGSEGKRMEILDEPITTSFESYQWHEELQFFSDNYAIGQNYSNADIFLATFDRGEGWLSNRVSTSQTYTFDINDFFTPNAFSIKPKLEFIIVGDGSNYNVSVEAGNSTSNLSNVTTISGSTFQKRFFNTDIDVSQVDGTGQCFVRFTVNSGHFRMAYIKLTYPQNYQINDSETHYLTLPINSSDISYLDISNPATGAEVYDITDENNLRRITSNLSVSNIQLAITGTSTVERNLYLHNNSFLSVSNIDAINFTNIDPTAYDYLIVTHPSLRQAAGEHSDIIQAYADYRESEVGGNHEVLIMNIDEIYNQFNYGETSPLGIRRFADFMFANGNPENIFLIGKAVALPGLAIDMNIRKNPTHFEQNLVPTYGWPPSDIALVVGLNSTGGNVPSIPIGRLSVTTAEQVLNYFNKVKSHESTAPALWQKNIVHLSGGNGEFEQTLFRGYVDDLKVRAEGDSFGGRVSTTTKSTTNPVELINISEQLNAGLGLITFFGHSSQNLTDLEIGNVSDEAQGYNNTDRYPVLLMNGCQLASIFDDDFTLSEDWLLTADRGAVAFVAHSYFGYSVPLRDYSRAFYNLSFRDFLGETVGNLVKQGIDDYVSGTNTVQVSHWEQMILQGDPAVKLVRADKPDYEVIDNQMFLETFNGTPVSTLSDSLNLRIIVSNVGLTTTQSFHVSVTRYFSDGSDPITYTSSVPYAAINYRDTISFTIPNDELVNTFGLNRFEVTVDYLDELDEFNEDNNIASFEFFVPTVSVLPVLPLEYAVVNQQPVVLTASAGNSSNEEREFIFEIDTSPDFDSPSKQSTTIQAGLTATWDVNLLTDNSTDSTVYYWRVNYADAINDPNILWGESSFVYIKDSSEGWSQSDFPQFSKASLDNIVRDDITETWKFSEIVKDIVVETYGSTNSIDYTEIVVSLDGLALVFDGRCLENTITALAFDKNTGALYPANLFASGVNCGRDSNSANYFTNSSIESGGLASYLGQVDEGDYVLMFSSGQVNFSNWTSEVTNTLQEIGGNPSIYNTLQTGHPYIIFGQKGALGGTAEEVIATSITNPTADAIRLETAINIGTVNGKISSTRIGPAEAWGQAIHDVRTSGADTYKFNIYGLDLSGTETLLLENLTNLTEDISSIDASVYPYMRLELELADEEERNPAQLKKWLVLYEGVAEGFIDIDAIGRAEYIISDKEEGEEFELEFAFTNLANINFKDVDSLNVEYKFTNLETLTQTTQLAKIKAPLGKETTRFKLNINTAGMGGKNELQVYVNPQDVPEQYYENNIFIVDFAVIPDDNNPLLEVAFDGRKILDGEIVSSNPFITIQLKDDNEFLTRNPEESLAITASLKRPCEGCDFESIDLNTNEIQFSEVDGVASVEFQLKNLEDGIYTLQAQGEDAAGNKAGTRPYTINFEVINESTVTNVFPYPNPFSSNVRFVFTLTGSEVPDQMKIQIMTISGKVVREITQDEIGPIHIGNNQTEFAWDGTDEFGDRLANGTYLYRVLMRKNGQGFKRRETSADKAFKNGYGKMYILR